MQGVTGRFWLPPACLDVISAEASRAYPKETGGIFMGYWAAATPEAVVTHIIGPGPNAVHHERSFTPDYEYQESGIDAHYAAAGRRHSYLGDWHTHPDSRQTWLSLRDRRTLGRIAATPDARSPMPLMGVFAGTPDDWIGQIWRGQRRRIGNGLLGAKVMPMLLEVW